MGLMKKGLIGFIEFIGTGMSKFMGFVEFVEFVGFVAWVVVKVKEV